MDMMAGMLKLIQQLCEGHNEVLQTFLGEDYTAEQKDIFSSKMMSLDDDDDKPDEDDDDDGGPSGLPDNIVQWTSHMIKQILDTMLESQNWQASMTGCEKKYTLVQQLFDTASELVQGPNLDNQKLL